jgi:hypothetical protein
MDRDVKRMRKEPFVFTNLKTLAMTFGRLTVLELNELQGYVQPNRDRVGPGRQSASSCWSERAQAVAIAIRTRHARAARTVARELTPVHCYSCSAEGGGARRPKQGCSEVIP